MIPLNQEQRLGRASYYLMISRRTGAGFWFLIVATTLLVMSRPINSLVTDLLRLSGAPDVGTHVSSLIMYVDAGFWILGLLLTLVGVVIAKLEYSHYTFTFEEFDVRVKKGIFTILEVSIPYRSIQDVNIERTIMHRMSGTSRVVIDSAGEEEPEAHNETDIILEPIDHVMAEDIRILLQRKIGVQIVKTEGEADKEANMGISSSTAAPTGV